MTPDTHTFLDPEKGRNQKLITAHKSSLWLQEPREKEVCLTIFTHKLGVTDIKDMRAVVDVHPSIEQVKEIIEWLQSVVRQEPK